MIDFLIYILIGSLWCFGIFKIFDDILNPLAVIIECLIGHYWCKPLFYCPACMSSVHGITLGIIFFGLSFKVILFSVCLCGFNYVVNLLLPE